MALVFGDGFGLGRPEEELILSKTCLVNISSLAYEALYNNFEDGESRSRFTTGDLNTGQFEFDITADENKYSIRQTNIEEQIIVKRSVWQTTFADLLEKSITITMKKDGEHPLHNISAVNLLNLLNNVDINGSVIAYMRDRGYFVTKRDLNKTESSQIFVRLFHGAIENSLECVVDWCLEKGVDVDEMDYERRTFAVNTAVKAKNTSILEKILRKSPRLDVKSTRSTKTPLYLAVECQYTKGAELLLRHGADIKETDYYCIRSLLSTIIEKAETTEFFEMFVKETGGNVNICDSFGYTALHYAVRHERRDLIDFLIAKGADLEAASKFGSTALTLAAKRRRPNVLLKLVNAGADVFRKGKRGRNILHVIAETGCSYHRNNIVKTLIEKGVDLDMRDLDGRTPLHIAFSKRSCVKETLLAHGARVDIRDFLGQTVIDMFNSIEATDPNGNDRNSVNEYVPERIRCCEGRSWLRRDMLSVLVKLKMAGVRDLTVEFGVTNEEIDNNSLRLSFYQSISMMS